MGLLTLEVFTSVIESIRLQLEKDRLNAVSIAAIYNTDDINSYDNSLLIKSLVSLLQLHFPKKDNHCDIEHYMFDMNFGKVGEQKLITPEDLWDQLNQDGLDTVITWKNIKSEAYTRIKPLISTHSLIDEVGHWDQSNFNQTFKK